jgi:hypothetical protein
MYWNYGCDITMPSAGNAIAFGRGTVFNLKGGGSLTGGFPTVNIDDRGRVIVLIADRNTVLVESLTDNLQLGGCNLNMSAGRPHIFFCDGCKWHLIGHHNDF